jgi:hypothetical protein
MIKSISISAKCSDLFTATAHSEHGTVGDYDGYVPDFMPGKHYGDYVTLDIDIETGKILNWKPPTQTELEKVFNI